MTAVDAGLVIAVHEELLPHQLAVAFGTGEAAGMVELLFVTGELRCAFDEFLALVASLRVAVVEAVLTDVVPLLF